MDDISFLHTYLSAVTTQKHARKLDNVDMTDTTVQATIIENNTVN